MVALVPPTVTGDHAGSSYRRIIAEACARAVTGATAWPAEPEVQPAGRWLGMRHPRARIPDQGWKLHLSASVFTAAETLRRALPVLLEEPVTFKVAASAEALGALNSGVGRLSQVGKFITVYPEDDAQAVRLAVALDEATDGLSGPAIPSDRPLRPGSVVFYRYGGFGGLTTQSKNGEISPALRAPDGTLEPDLRRPVYRPPTWAVDPFIAAGVAGELPPAMPLVGHRYLALAALHRSARGGVFLAVDLDQPRRCVLKQAPAYAQAGPDGFDARDRLRHETDVLRRLCNDGRFPAVYDLVEHAGDHYLVLEDIAGETLEQRLIGLSRQGRFLPDRQVAAWGRELAAMLGAIHAAGLVYRDLKSTNVLAAADGRLRLLDFELACDTGAAGAAGTGTRGYISPQQAAGAPASVSDDIYALGAMLVFLATGAEPSQAPRPDALLDRPLRLLNPAIGHALVAVIERCLEPDPAVRFPAMSAVDVALASLDRQGASAPIPYGSETDTSEQLDTAARLRARSLARRLAETIRAMAARDPQRPGLTWTSHHPLTDGVRARDVNTGAAGTALALAELVDEFDEPADRDALRQSADWLRDAPRPEGDPLPGLYAGEAGIGAALLRAGQVLADQDLIDAAAARGSWIATLPHESPDLFNGTAGRLRFHLVLWDETGDPAHMAHAVSAGDVLLACAEDAGDGAVRWPIPAGYGGLSGKRYLGYAHGAAGIADALLDLFDAAGGEQYREIARGAGAWLRGLATPVLDDESGASWPSTEGEETAAAFWCHGSAGIGRFWLHAAALDLLPEAEALARRSLIATARAARWSSPVPCHGLAGGIELLLDAYQADGQRTHLAEARSLQRLLEAFALEQDGRLVWPSESPAVITPDYHVGYAGVAATLLRMAEPERRPYGLSRRGFRFRARSVKGGDDARRDDSAGHPGPG